jgi:hypothetical protein
MEEKLNAGDSVYKWTVRTLYICAIALNVYFLFQQYKDTDGGKELAGKYEKMKQKMRKPFNDRKKFRRDATETIVEAWMIVDDAKKEMDNEQ